MNTITAHLFEINKYIWIYDELNKNIEYYFDYYKDICGLKINFRSQHNMD